MNKLTYDELRLMRLLRFMAAPDPKSWINTYEFAMDVNGTGEKNSININSLVKKGFLRKRGYDVKIINHDYEECFQ